MSPWALCAKNDRHKRGRAFSEPSLFYLVSRTRCSALALLRRADPHVAQAPDQQRTVASLGAAPLLEHENLFCGFTALLLKTGFERNFERPLCVIVVGGIRAEVRHWISQVSFWTRSRQMVESEVHTINQQY